MNVQIIRTFNIEKFGVWNCDYPVLNSMKQITANFVDKEGNTLDLNSVTVVYKELNGIFTYYNSKIKIVPKKEQMIWAVYGNHFIYLKFKEFLKCKIDPETTEYTFAMNIHTDSIKSREDIKRIVGLWKGRQITAIKNNSKKRCTLTQKLNVGHCGSACRRSAQGSKKSKDEK